MVRAGKADVFIDAFDVRLVAVSMGVKTFFLGEGFNLQHVKQVNGGGVR